MEEEKIWVLGKGRGEKKRLVVWGGELGDLGVWKILDGEFWEGLEGAFVVIVCWRGETVEVGIRGKKYG
ncbi:hypothetical protein, partial [Siminovitchia fortis]|uniref:hypothetical protein n=1 Tax=Siminovitchia fortis TaxID=254758 RepID=UPI0011AA40DB